MQNTIFDEGIEAERPGIYCKICGIRLRTIEEEEWGICEDCFEVKD